MSYQSFVQSIAKKMFLENYRSRSIFLNDKSMLLHLSDVMSKLRQSLHINLVFFEHFHSYLRSVTGELSLSIDHFSICISGQHKDKNIMCLVNSRKTWDRWIFERCGFNFWRSNMKPAHEGDRNSSICANVEHMQKQPTL